MHQRCNRYMITALQFCDRNCRAFFARSSQTNCIRILIVARCKVANCSNSSSCWYDGTLFRAHFLIAQKKPDNRTNCTRRLTCLWGKRTTNHNRSRRQHNCKSNRNRKMKCAFTDSSAYNHQYNLYAPHLLSFHLKTDSHLCLRSECFIFCFGVSSSSMCAFILDWIV